MLPSLTKVWRLDMEKIGMMIEMLALCISVGFLSFRIFSGYAKHLVRARYEKYRAFFVRNRYLLYSWVLAAVPEKPTE